MSKFIEELSQTFGINKPFAFYQFYQGAQSSMKSFRPPRILTQDDLMISPKKYQKTNTESAPNILRPDIINPQNKNGLQERSYKKSSSQMNLNSKYFLEPIKPSLMKTMLKDSYTAQIIRQREQKTDQKRRKIMEEKDFLSQFQGKSQLEANQRKQAKQEYKRQLLQQIQAKKIIVNYSKTQEASLERLYQQPREHNLEHKSYSFKKFYSEAQCYQNRVADEYLGYMAKEQDYIRSRNKNKIMDFEPNYELMRRQRQLQIKIGEQKKLELRRMLDQQIEKKQRERQMVLKQSRSRAGKQGAYDPIVNPIDYKLDINNKYVLAQLLKPNTSQQ